MEIWPLQKKNSVRLTHIKNTYEKYLDEDKDGAKYYPNRIAREVHSGHYVKVLPTELPDPELVIWSPDLCTQIRFTDPPNDKQIKFLSGDMSALSQFNLSWATPYALAIYGRPMLSNCPYGNGKGYGDGRAISVAEITYDNKRYELQLKGAGGTPFRRSGDGRAALRSSVREFLASEAMHSLGVRTTRALSLIVSKSEKIVRAWLSQESTGKNDTMILEPAAILCRVAPSFIRVGHIDLFARRVLGQIPNITQAEQNIGLSELRKMVEFTIFRDFPDIVQSKFQKCNNSQILEFLRQSSIRIAELTSEWIRVGFCQGNFNSDNCLVSGYQMDYGPFGFIEKYDPYWNMWVDGGKHFSFMNQMNAGHENFKTLVDSVIPLFQDNFTDICEAENIAKHHYVVGANALNDVWRRKLGLKKWKSVTATLLSRLLDLMEKCKADYTILWRKLIDCKNVEDLTDSFYMELSVANASEFNVWISDWLSLEPDFQLMKKTNPIFVPREWMLVEAYEKANKGDYSMVNELYELFKNPYEVQNKNSLKYFTKAPNAVKNKPGTAFVTCSS